MSVKVFLKKLSNDAKIDMLLLFWKTGGVTFNFQIRTPISYCTYGFFEKN